jgi:hypothetical protein
MYLALTTDNTQVGVTLSCPIPERNYIQDERVLVEIARHEEADVLYPCRFICGV